MLSEVRIEYTQTCVGGLKQPKHKSYEYELDLGENLYQLELLTKYGRPGHDNGSVNLERI